MIQGHFMQIMSSEIQFRTLEMEQLFYSLNIPIQKIIMNMRQAAFNILKNKSQVIDEFIDVTNDSDDIWYSYAIKIDLPPDDVLKMNKSFISFCMDNGLIELLKAEVTFRFETGERNACKPKKSFINCSQPTKY